MSFFYKQIRFQIYIFGNVNGDTVGLGCTPSDAQIDYLGKLGAV